MSLMRFIGDVHGKFGAYNAVLQGCEQSIQVGDFGLAFSTSKPTMRETGRFIRGNHDNPTDCWPHPQYMGDYGFRGPQKIFFLSGALTPPHLYRRVPGFNWWEDEELKDEWLEKAFEAYRAAKPRIMVTHCLPHRVQQSFFHFNPACKSRTGVWLDAMFDVYKPEIWVCGHYHRSVDKHKSGTRFVVLDELAHIDLGV